jgi:hypothetical protein
MSDNGPQFEDLELLSAKDAELSDVFTPEFLERYEVHSYRNASRILANSCPDELAELVSTLTEFQIRVEEVVAAGGNKSTIAKSMDSLRLSPVLGIVKLKVVPFWEPLLESDSGNTSQ